MRKISREELGSLIKQERISKRLARELRFVPKEIQDWDSRDFLAISNKSGSEGILLLDVNGFYLIPYVLTKSISGNHSGWLRPITCDLCLTWQSGASSARITMTRKADNHTFTYLCCANLFCSLHVRDLTDNAILSRTHLREDITVENRIKRHQKRMLEIIKILDQKPITMS